MRTRPRTRRGGFTILEVVLAMSILLVGMTSILGLLSFGAALVRTAELRGAAAQAMEAVVADLEENLFPMEGGEEGDQGDAFGRAGEPRSFTDRPVPGRDDLRYSARATPAPGDGDGPLEYRVDVEISWSAAGARRSATFRTLLLREIPFDERMRRLFVQGEAAEPAPDSPEVPEVPAR